MEISNWRERQGWMIKWTLLVYRMAHFRSAWCVCLENALSMVFIELFKILHKARLGGATSALNAIKLKQFHLKKLIFMKSLSLRVCMLYFFVFIQDDPQDWTFRIMPSCPHSRHGYGTVTISWVWYGAGTRLLSFYFLLPSNKILWLRRNCCFCWIGFNIYACALRQSIINIGC